MQRAEEDAQFNMDKRRGIAQEKRAAKLERDEAEKYQQVKDELVTYFIPLCNCFFFRLLNNASFIYWSFIIARG